MTTRIQAAFTGIQYPLDHPRIGWQAHGGTVSVSSADAGFPGAAALDPRTITAWRPQSLTANWILTFPEPSVVSYVGIGAHNLGSTGCEVRLQIPDGGGGWTLIPGTEGIPSDDGALVFLIMPRVLSAIRVLIRDLGGASIPTIGHIRVGEVMEWPQRAQFTGLPITEARQIEYQFNQSQTGEFMGMTVERKGLQFPVTIQHLSEAWAAEKYAPFRKHADAGQTFFITTRPGKYPGEVAYCYASSLVQSERALPNFRISRDVTMNLRGYARNG